MREGLAEVAEEAGLERIKIVAWRDLGDPEAGGSELHTDRIATHWAEAGLDVEVHTSAVPGESEIVKRGGYRAIRRSGRYAVFGWTAMEGLIERRRRGEGLVEVWNGMPFFSPLWYRGPRIVFLHHVHAEMWDMVLPPRLAKLGRVVESKVAPPIYRDSRIVTLSESSKEEIIAMLGMREERISVAPPGIEPEFSPGGERSTTPLVVAVGRLVPVKRFDLLIEALVKARRKVPDLEAVIIGEGYERARLEALRDSHGADWIAMPGRVEDLVEWYRRAWVVAGTSLREGWGMTMTEAAACGTPAVATDIAGHRDAVLDGRTGILTSDRGFDEALAEVLIDAILRRNLAKGALERSRWFTWEATARSTLSALAEETRPQASVRRQRRRQETASAETNSTESQTRLASDS